MATRWGILGTGVIARKFAAALKDLPDAQVQAIGSRSLASAQAFAAEFSIPLAFGSYAGIAECAEIDVVYIATPHSCHFSDTLLCLQQGKAVLCEKPFALNAAQAIRMVQEARSRDLFLMEAMWTRFFPVMEKLRGLVYHGALGRVRMIQADFGFKADRQAHPRLFDRALGGGSLLDVGVYPVSLASMLLGEPYECCAAAILNNKGVEEQFAGVLHYRGGAMAQISSSLVVDTPQEAWILGEDARIHIPAPWWRPATFSISRPGKSEDVSLPYSGNGYQYQAQEVQRCLAAGLFESPIMPLDESVSIMRALDRLGASAGVPPF